MTVDRQVWVCIREGVLLAMPCVSFGAGIALTFTDDLEQEEKT